ncbi:MAG: hypothetical protein KGQ70_02630, partial [Alphaproteobacteria bacterium]|nr:hypothetical protein [Alphaproteobacteria bacterium]
DPGYIWRNDVTKWAGRTVRVRGWVTDVDDKPVIEVTDKGQIDVLAQSPPSAPAGAKSVKSAK